MAQARSYSTLKTTMISSIGSLTSASATDELSVILRSTGRLESAWSPERKNIRGIPQNIEDMEDSQEEEIQKQR